MNIRHVQQVPIPPLPPKQDARNLPPCCSDVVEPVAQALFHSWGAGWLSWTSSPPLHSISRTSILPLARLMWSGVEQGRLFFFLVVQHDYLGALTH